MIHYAREVEADSLLDFFEKWFIVMKPVIPLAGKEISVLARFALERFMISQTVQDDKIIDTIVLNKETRSKVMKECGISYNHLYAYLTKFKKLKIINNNRFDLSLLPPIKKGDTTFNMVYMFKINGV